jgi:hypothetical protein
MSLHILALFDFVSNYFVPSIQTTTGIPHQLLRRMLDAAGEHDTQLACLSAMTQLVLHSEAAVHQVRI